MSSHPMDLGVYVKSSSCEGSFSALMPFVGAAIQSKYSTSTVPAGFPHEPLLDPGSPEVLSSRNGPAEHRPRAVSNEVWR